MMEPHNSSLPPDGAPPLTKPRQFDSTTPVNPVAGQGSTPEAPGRTINPLASLKAHPLLALLVATLVVVAGTPVAWVLGKPRYYTEAVIRVSPRFLKNLNQDQELELQSNSQYREFVQQQVNTINRYDIVFDALKNLGDQRRLYQTNVESDRRAAERLAMELAIRPVLDSYLVTVGLEGAKPEGMAEVINAVVQTYLERAKSEEFYASDERIGNIQEERKKLLQDLDQKSGERTALAQEIGVTTFNESFLNPYDQLLTKSKEALAAARRRRIEVEAQLAALENVQGPGRTAADAMAQEMAEKDNGLSSLKANLNTRRSQVLSKLSGLATEHPGRRALERELSEIDAEIARATDILIKSFRTMILDQRRADVYQARQTEKELTAQVAAEASQANWFSSRYHQALGLGEDIDRTRKRIAAVDDRVDFLTLEASAPGFVRLVSLARTPEIPIKGGRRKLLLMVMLAGLILGLAAPIAADFLDPRLHDPNDLHRVLGFPPMGWIVERGNEQTKLFAQDQLIRLATSLDRERRANGTKVLTFTADKAGEGTTTLVLELTQALTQLGIGAIAVEANAFKPDERYLQPNSSGTQTNRGLVGLLDNLATVDDVVMPRTNSLPDRISVGQAKGRRPLATIDQVRQTLGELAQHYEMVLLDAPPLLLSADAELLIALSDATLVIVEAERAQKSEIKRAAHLLERLSPPVVGAILNRVRTHAAGGYFADVLKEHRTGKRLPRNKLLSPWLWK